MVIASYAVLSAACRLLVADAVGELSLMFQRRAARLQIGVGVQNYVLCHDVLTQERQACLFRQVQDRFRPQASLRRFAVQKSRGTTAAWRPTQDSDHFAQVAFQPAQARIRGPRILQSKKRMSFFPGWPGKFGAASTVP